MSGTDCLCFYMVFCISRQEMSGNGDYMMKSKVKKRSLWSRVKKEMNRNWILYVMILPVIIYFLIFEYYPMYGVTLAFKDFNTKLGILSSPWVGFKHFKRLFQSYNFVTMLLNTLGISVYGLVVGFTLPIIFALMLHYVSNRFLKKTVQLVSYAPHFLSTVVVCSMITLFCTSDTGAFNILRRLIGLESVNFLAKPEWFKDIHVWSGVWQGTGWSAIIYLSALAGVDPEQHEAAIMDGATKIQRMWYIDIPAIKGTIVMLLILRMGSVMSVGFEKAFLLQNDLNYSASLIISTYVYEVGMLKGDYSFSTAVGLFNNVINVILLVGANYFSKKVLEESLF